MEVNYIPEKCVTGTLDNFGGSSTVDGSLYGVAFRDDASQNPQPRNFTHEMQKCSLFLYLFWPRSGPRF